MANSLPPNLTSVRDVLHRVLDSTNRLQTLLELGREDWSEFHLRLCKGVNAPTTGFDDELQLRCADLDCALADARGIVGPFDRRLSETHTELWGHAGIVRENCAQWIIERAVLVHACAEEMELVDASTGEVAPLEDAIRCASLPAPYDRDVVVLALDKELRAVGKEINWQSSSSEKLESDLKPPPKKRRRYVTKAQAERIAQKKFESLWRVDNKSEWARQIGYDRKLVDKLKAWNDAERRRENWKKVATRFEGVVDPKIIEALHSSDASSLESLSDSDREKIERMSDADRAEVFELLSEQARDAIT